MFLGPYQEGGDFRDLGLQGPYGFLNRLHDTVMPASALADEQPSGAIEQKLHATIRKVTEDIGALRYNTAIAAMMEYLNAVREGGRAANRAEVEPLVMLVAPFAPHLAEELWQELGHATSLFEKPSWPGFDPVKATSDAIELVVQVNGKVRARLAVARGTPEADALDAARSDENVVRYIADKTTRKVIFVQDRLLNIVVG